MRPGAITNPTAAAKLTLVTLARRWLRLTAEIAALDGHLDELTTATASTLVALNGVGTQTASPLLTAAGDNPDRLARERSLAALCGSSPIDASSGRQQRHRLNRGGDRHANAALYIIAISRLRWDTATKTYMQRRLAQGKTRKEITAASSATSPGKSTEQSSTTSPHHNTPPLPPDTPLDIHRSIGTGAVAIADIDHRC